jgi:hypothetical protein
MVYETEHKGRPRFPNVNLGLGARLMARAVGVVMCASSALLPNSAPAAPIVYNSQAAFTADLNLAVPTTYNFEVGSGFPAAGGNIGTVGGVTFSAQTDVYPDVTSGTQAMTGAGGTFTTATVNFENLATRPNAVSLYGLDLTQFGPEVVRVSATFTTGATQAYEVRLAPGVADFTPTFFGVIDRTDTIKSLSILGTNAGGQSPDRAWLIDDLSQAYVPPAAIASQQVTQTRTAANGVTWPSNYKVSFENGQIAIHVNILLVDMSNAPLTSPPMLLAPRIDNSDGCGLLLTCIWEKGIEGMWSGRYNVVDQNLTYPLLFDVNFVSSGQDYRTRVDPTPGCSSQMSRWCIDNISTNERQDEVAAHEFGHQVGLFDEYSIGAVDPTTPPGNLCVLPSQAQLFCNSLMADLGLTQQRYYESILATIDDLFGRSLTLAFAGQPPYPGNPPDLEFASHHDAPDNFGVPQPPTIVFVLAGTLLGLGLRLRLRRRSRSAS